MSGLYDTLLAELRRARALGHDPAASALWLRAPWGLRRRYANGELGRDDFYRALTRWLEFKARGDEAA